MISRAHRRVVYLVFAGLTLLALLGAPSIVPAAHAECIPVGSPSCGG